MSMIAIPGGIIVIAPVGGSVDDLDAFGNRDGAVVSHDEGERGNDDPQCIIGRVEVDEEIV